MGTYSITVGELAKHGHTRNGYYGTDNSTGNTSRQCASWKKLANDPTDYGVNDTGNDERHNNIQPYSTTHYYLRLK